MTRGMFLLLAVLAQTQTQTQTQPPQTPAAPAAQPPPATEVYLVPLGDPAAWQEKAGELVVNISSSPEYDNQPSFMRDSRSILFTSRRDGQQTDIYRYWIADRKTTRLTETTEDEYSAALVPAGNGFSVIRVEMPVDAAKPQEREQRLWAFDLAGKNPQLVLSDLKPIGYHAWIDATTVMVFVLGQPATLQRATPGAITAETVTGNIGRSLVPIPGARAVSFTQRDDARGWWFKRYDADTRQVRTLTKPPADATSEPYATWTRDGRLITAAGTRIYSWKEGDAGWTLVGDLAKAPIKNISRIAVSPDGRWLAFVAEPRTE